MALLCTTTKKSSWKNNFFKVSARIWRVHLLKSRHSPLIQMTVVMISDTQNSYNFFKNIFFVARFILAIQLRSIQIWGAFKKFKKKLFRLISWPFGFFAFSFYSSPCSFYIPGTRFLVLPGTRFILFLQLLTW